MRKYPYFIAFASVVVFASAAIGQTVVEPSGDGSNGLFDGLLTTISTKPIEALIAAVFAIIITPAIQSWNHRRKIRSIFADVSVPRGDKKNSIMIIGEGGSGKTTLGKRICGITDNAHTEKTETFTTYDGSVSDQSGKFHYFVSDYKGQNIGTKIRGFLEQQLIPNTPFRFGFLNTLIVVVDIAADEENFPEEMEPKDYPKIAKEKASRIDENLDQWNRTALDAVFGMHDRDSLKFVCLFINKFDRLDNPSSKAMERIIDLYKELAEDLDRRCHYEHEVHKDQRRYAHFEIIVGSADEGPTAAFSECLKVASVPLSSDAEDKFRIGEPYGTEKS